MWCVGGLQVHRTRSRRLVYKEVVKTRLNYKRSYFWSFGNPACGDSTGSNWIEKDQFSNFLTMAKTINTELFIKVWQEQRCLGDFSSLIYTNGYEKAKRRYELAESSVTCGQKPYC